MINEAQKHAWFVQSLETLELIDSQIAMASSIEHIPAEYATTELWEAVREMMPANRMLLMYLKEAIQLGGKAIDNEALVAHTLAVLQAP